MSDQGPGVPPELRERVFEKFFRVEHLGGGSGRVPGTGLGLYLCREVVHAHGGSIRCESADGVVGARVAVTLPAAPGQPDARTTAPPPAADGRGGGGT